MQRPVRSVSGHVGSRCVHLFDGFVRSGLKWTPLSDVISRRHHPRKRMIQYSRAVEVESRRRSVLDTPLSRGMTADARLAFRGFWPQISTGRLAVDEPLA